MSQPAPAAAADGPEALKVASHHTSAGHVSVAWTTAEGGNLAAVSAGADGRVLLQQIKPAKQLREFKGSEGPIHVFSASPSGSLAAMADGTYVKAVRLPELTIKGPLTRFTAPPCCAAWSRDGSQVAAGADDGCIKLVTVADTKVRCTLRSEGYVRGLALEPDSKFLAAANADGSLLVWSLEGGGSKQELKRRVAPKLDHEDTTARQGLAWDPEGTVLAVAGTESDVVLLEALSWNVDGYLAGGHTGNVAVVAFSPNGIYAATAGATDAKAVIWHVGRREVVATRSLPAPASSLAWHTATNLLLVGSSGGGHAIWPNPVPEQQGDLAQPWPSPWKPVDQIDREEDRRLHAAEAAAAANSTGSGLEDDDFVVDDLGTSGGCQAGGAAAAAALGDDDDDDDDAPSVIRRRGLKKLGGLGDELGGAGGAAAPAAAQAAAPTAGDVEAYAAEVDALVADLQAGLQQPQPHQQQVVTQVVQARPKKPQRPIQPGSTPPSEADGSASGGARFLAYNQLGCVVSKAVDDHHVIEVSFLDTAKHRLRVPNLTDLYGFRAASLGARGVAYISPVAEALDGAGEQPSMVVYRGFESWAAGTDWTVALPVGEEALAVAAGGSCVAVATSERLLRIYSLAGRQLGLVSIPGTPVAVVAAGPVDAEAGGPAAAVAHQLAVVWAEGPPEPFASTQQLAFQLYDVARCAAVAQGSVALSPGASLAWAGFSKEGCLATYDSAGTLRLRSPEWGGTWVPLLNADVAKATAGAARLWPVWLDCNTLTAVATTAKAPHPAVLPRPLLTQVPLALPMAAADGGAAVEEEQLLRAGLLAAHVKSLADASSAGGGSDEDLAAALSASEVACDKKALPLFLEYVKAGKQARALEVVGSLHLLKSIEGALKLANRQHMSALAERIQAFLEQRLEWEEQQAAAAADLAAEDAYAAGTAAAAAAAAAAGGGAVQGLDNDMEVQQDQASQFVGAAGSSGNVAASKLAAAAAAAPMFAAKGAGGGGSGGGGIKRKPGAADIGAAGPGAGGGGSKAGGGGSGSNPFARKKVVR